jgi:hypothetical protein
MGQAENKKKAYQLIKDIMFRKVDFFELEDKDYEFIYKTYEYEHKKLGDNIKELQKENNMFKASVTLFNVVRERLLNEYENDLETCNLLVKELIAHGEKVADLIDCDEYLKQYEHI